MAFGGSFRCFGILPDILPSVPPVDSWRNARRRLALLAAVLAVSLVGAACSGEARGEPGAAGPGAGTPAPSAPGVTVPVAASGTSPASTTSTTRDIATTTSTSSSTTTTVPPLDRSDAATIERMLEDISLHGLDMPRYGGSEPEAATVAALAATVETITGHEAVVDPVPLPDGDVSANVWAAPIGTGDITLLLGAHIDTVERVPGVDDNGSGTVVLLELLRRLAEDPPSAVTVTAVFFGAEEVLPGHSGDDHHYGSRHAAAQLRSAGELPDAMVSIDMIGVGDRLVAVAYEDTDPAMALSIAAAGATLGIEIDTLSRGDISDHEAFAGAGVAAAMLWRPDNPAWHTSGDTEVSPDHLLEDLAVIEAVIAAMRDGAG